MSDPQDPHDPFSDPSHGASPFDPVPDLSPAAGPDADLGVVPLFPLPNVVLMPRAVLPLHVFEERYKEMTRHALEGDRRVAMALLRPGWEKNYYSRPAIEPVVCVGTILAHEKLPDGKYNFLLQGTHRARILSEVGQGPYRQARLVRVAEVPIDEAELAAQRRRMIDAFAAGPMAHTVAGRQFERLLSAPLPTSDLADLIAFNFLDDVWLKQSLLADPDVRRRVDRAVEALEALRPLVPSASFLACRNPGVN